MIKGSKLQANTQERVKHLKSTIIFKSCRLFSVFLLTLLTFAYSSAQENKPIFSYIISIPNPNNHTYHVQLNTNGWNQDSIYFKMPNWMPGYYQIMNYSNDVNNMLAKDNQGKEMPLKKINSNTWVIINQKNKAFKIEYDIITSRQFVANSYIDAEHAYIIPENTFLYVDGYLNFPVSVLINNNPLWNKIATGLAPVTGKPKIFMAPNFDILYDCPILIGNLEELPSFKVKAIEHQFIGYKMGTFDQTTFVNNLQKVVEAASDIIGDIPYEKYTFIAIGPGRGGIEHLNNTTVSFDGNQLKTDANMNTVMNFLAHEYFHNYNVKRIRPFELGPFDYDSGSKTNLLWVSEGLSVYYEYLTVRRAGLINEETLFSDFENNINTFENNPGRFYQSLTQASYNTWRDGPFGAQGDEKGKSISYYQKGPIVGLLLDFAIRNATQNKKSLDNVMQLVYWKYYKKEQRGFTDAEFQQTCEEVAGTPLTQLFEYVYTTKELDYNTYLNFGGLKLISTEIANQKKKYTLSRLNNSNTLQLEILNSWLGNHL